MANLETMNAAELLALLASGDAAALDFAKRAVAGAGLRIAKAGAPSESSEAAAERLLGTTLADLKALVAEAVAGLPVHGADGDPDTTGYKVVIEARPAAKAGVGVPAGGEKGVQITVSAIPTRTLSPKYIESLKKCGKMKA